MVSLTRGKILGIPYLCLVAIAIITFLNQIEASERSITDNLRRLEYNLAEPKYDRDVVGTSSSNSLASNWDTDLVFGSTPPSDTTSMTVYKEPSGWLLTILKSLFTDIDWNTIEEARVQIEKFVRRVEEMVGKFRNVFTAVGGNGNHNSANADSRSSADGPKLSARLWGKGDSKSSSTASKLDAAKVKEMLERVACFVGYARLMNLSNEALAELDASKVVTNLFGSSGKRNSSGWKWFG